MVKRLLFYFMCAAILFVTVFTVYKVYKPEVISDDDTINFNVTNKIRPDQLLDELTSLEEGQSLAVCFYEKNDISSKYFLDSVLQNILNKYSLNRFDKLTFINLSTLESEEKADFMNKYKFTAAPCISVIKIEGADICEVDSIENNGIDQIGSVSVVEQFMITNEIIEETAS